MSEEQIQLFNEETEKAQQHMDDAVAKFVAGDMAWASYELGAAAGCIYSLMKIIADAKQRTT